MHGDDCMSLGTDESLDWMRAELENECELKHGGRIGPEDRDGSEARVLNRVVCWDRDGLRMEADQRHVEIALKAMDMEDSRAVGTPGVDAKPGDEK